jgi:hypothetical protein
MGSSIKNSNVEVTISQNLVEALRNNRPVAQTSHKGLIKNTGITGRGGGLLCQGLSLDEAQTLFNANDRVSEAGREVINASATRTNDNEDVDFKLHSSPMTSEVLSDSLFNTGILSSHLFNVGNLSNYHLKAGNLSKSHVHKLSDSHAFLASSLSDDNLSLSDSQALSPFELSGILSFKCDDLCHCYHQTNCLAYQSVTTCHWYHQTNCLASQRVTTCHRYSSVTTCHCISNLTIPSLCPSYCLAVHHQHISFCPDIPSVSQYTFLGLYTCIVGTSFREIYCDKRQLLRFACPNQYFTCPTRPFILAQQHKDSFFCMRYHN